MNTRPATDLKIKLLRRIKKTKKGCWQWLGARFKSGYGQIRIGTRKDNKLKRVHRVSYEVFIDKIQNNLELDHLCHNLLCINPKHLHPVTHTENMRRRRERLLAYCKYGHKYNKKNTLINLKGWRSCRICNNNKSKKSYAKHNNSK